MNSITLIGRLTSDPESAKTKSGTTRCRFRLAVRKLGSETPVFVDVVAWDRLGDNCAEYLARGRQVAVVGRLDYDEWTDTDGGRHSRHQVVANQVDFLGSARAEADKEAEPVEAF